eukprot:TRINITY_DN1118_c0_g1_i1.p1 TRINITY_DN1118_c0_g1~~TRINITY_DN1118_c0_g1_i1.p1  ORF type:complete len:429 (-),score=109.25 TRINITY_DN1118_c0_g1_i1:581-1867(-)
MLPRSLLRSAARPSASSRAFLSSAAAAAGNTLSSAAPSSYVDLQSFSSMRFLSSSSITMEVGASRDYSRDVSTAGGSALKYEQATSYHYDSSIQRFMAAKEWKSVFKTMRQMSDAGLQPNLWKVSHQLKESCTQEDIWREFVEVVEMLREDGHLQESPEAFSFAMSVCSQFGWSDLVVKLFDEMKHAGFVQQWAYLEVLNAYRVQMDYSSATDTLREMLSLYPLSDADYCDVHRLTMEICIENGRWEDALQLFQEMDSGEGRRDISCFRLALQTCSMLANRKLALQFLNEIRVSSLIPDDVCYKHVIQTCASCGDAETAGSLFVEFASKRFSKAPKGSWICSTSDTTWECFEIAFGSCISSGRGDLAEKVLADMFSVLESGGKQSPQSAEKLEKTKISDADLDRLRTSVSNLSESSKLDFDLFINSRL